MGNVGDQRALRDTLGVFATGVTIVTTLDAQGSAWGFTANSFTSVSLDPPLVLVCLAKHSGSIETFMAARHYAVNILSDQQRDLSMRFSAGGPEKFDRVSWSARRTGSPILDDVAAWLDCDMHQAVDAGDHMIFIGEVVDFASGGAAPLGYCRGAYVPLALDQRLFQATGTTSRMQVGAILEHKRRVFLQRHPRRDEWSVPAAASLGAPDKPRSLLGRLGACGVQSPPLFVFSVYDDGDVHNVIYRGELVDAPAVLDDARQRFFAFSDIPWGAIVDPMVRNMLVRYIRERSNDAFGVYVGDTNSGIVQALR